MEIIPLYDINILVKYPEGSMDRTIEIILSYLCFLGQNR